MKKVKQFAGLVSTFFLLLGAFPPLMAYNLKIEPELFHFSEVKVGKKFQLRQPLFIYNESDEAATFTLDIVKPSAINIDWIKGYEEIPDTSWFGFESQKVKIPARSTVNILLHVDIPKQEKYYNQHYVLSLAVRQELESGQVTSKRFMYPLVYIETEFRKWVKNSPAGKTGVSPSVMTPRSLKLGKNEAKDCCKLTVFNNGINPNTYTIIPTTEFAFGKEQQVKLTSDFEWLPNPEWLEIQKKVTIGPGKSEVLSVNIDLPQMDSLHHKDYEAIVYLQDQEGRLSFVRVQMHIQ